MKKIINGKKYDTATDTDNVAENNEGENKTDAPASGSISGYANILKNRNLK